MLSSEKILMRTKTLKDNNPWAQNFDSLENSLKSTLNKKQPTKRTDLLMMKQLTQANTHSAHNENIDGQEFAYSYSNIEISSDEERMVVHVLQNHFLFKDFDPLHIKLIVDDLYGCSIEQDRTLFEENDEGFCFYLIKSGTLEVLCNGERKKVLSAGDCIGELALLQQCYRTTTVRSLTDCEIYVLEGTVFREILESLNRSSFEEILEYLNCIPFLNDLTYVEKQNITTLTSSLIFQKGEKIISQGEISTQILIIKEGTMSFKNKRGKEVKILKNKDFIGDNGVLFNLPMQYDVYANCVCSVYIFSITTFEEAIGFDFRNNLLYTIFRECLLKNDFFMNFFLESHFQELFTIFELKFYKSNDIVFSKDINQNKNMVVILEGMLVEVILVIFILVFYRRPCS
jgi:CRP-like cAMP-binding protein